ncbi:hypothetical protein [Halocola ammonii]
MIDTPERVYNNFETSFEELKTASALTRKEKTQRLASQINLLSRTKDGIKFLYEKSLDVEAAGFFADSPWKEPRKLVPSLVKGTLRAGSPTSDFEVMSDLRMLAYANGRSEGEASISQEEAQQYLEEIVVHNLEFVFEELTEESRAAMSSQEQKKVFNLFRMLSEHAGLDNIKSNLAEEIKLTCEQRPIVTRKARRLIHMVRSKISLDGGTEADKTLQFYVDSIHGPSPLSKKCESREEYASKLDSLSSDRLEEEAESLGRYLQATGLSNGYLGSFVLKVVHSNPDLIPLALGLSPSGKAEWSHHQSRVSNLIEQVVTDHNYQCLYGLAMMLEKSLFARRAVRAGLNNLLLVNIHSQIEKRILKSVIQPHESVTAKQYLIGATIRTLGQPLGVGQGNNATCQSARGISMWSQHSPAKLINMIITVATQNNLVMRFETQDLESIKLGKGLIDKLDYNLDAVSAILVPHLDKIYNEMMRRAANRGEDPHKWVNPTLYGSWIQMGFAGVYDYFTQSIHDYKGFVKIFYAAFHPDLNGGRKMVYPNPVGIFITSNRGDMVGFHAISLLRVKKNPNTGEIRCYFLNPNNEGRQDWGQGIKPTVFGNGERHGESSLPFHQFVARVYAFHYNNLEAKNHFDEVPQEEIDKVYKLSKESWGTSYVWHETPRQW